MQMTSGLLKYIVLRTELVPQLFGTFFLPKLQLFMSQNTGLANQMMNFLQQRFESNFLCLVSFFNVLVQPRCSFFYHSLLF